ncbi:MAG TPA: hypothetical protein VGZ72_04420 [Stellaceae bacterium]|jgi:hypothetical protein|nr:hypothetical protein [Stellaceae bacterium]
MTLPTQFSLLDSEFNEFLFATVGEERIGVPLSVLSAFARLGLDPWVEAARLSDLPKDSAVTRLSGAIASLPAGRWELAETRGIAARLIEALPRRRSALRTEAAKPKEGSRRARLPSWLIFVAVGAGLLLGMAASGQLPWGGSASRSVPSAHSE